MNIHTGFEFDALAKQILPRNVIDWKKAERTCMTLPQSFIITTTFEGGQIFLKVDRTPGVNGFSDLL